MYAEFSNIINLQGSASGYQHKLKQHHHVKLSKEFKADCKVWLHFLNSNLGEVVNRPMVDILGTIQTSDEIAFYSDASAAKNLGFGCVLRNHWTQAFWEPNFIQQEKPSIKFLKLFALTAGILMWRDDVQLRNCRISVFCNNQSVVQMINSMISSCQHCMKLIRILTLDVLQCNRRLTSRYISSKANFLSDSLLRGQWTRFRKLGPHMNQSGDVISDQIWPIWKVWSK